MHGLILLPVDPAGGQLYTVQRRGVDAGVRESHAKRPGQATATAGDVDRAGYAVGIMTSSGRIYPARGASERCYRPHATGTTGRTPQGPARQRRSGMTDETHRVRKLLHNTCRGRGQPLFLLTIDSAEQSATPNPRGIPRPRALHQGPELQRTSMPQGSGAVGVIWTAR